jgi:very-short-patch-repair endonuclease
MKELVPQRLLGFSRRLRTNQTPWEEKLWMRLRAGRFYGLKFKRQSLIGEYIVDFYCHSKKLVIELDGGHHNEETKKISDQYRLKFLKDKGYIVHRFWNSDIDNNLDGVLETIKNAARV